MTRKYLAAWEYCIKLKREKCLRNIYISCWQAICSLCKIEIFGFLITADKGRAGRATLPQHTEVDHTLFCAQFFLYWIYYVIFLNLKISWGDVSFEAQIVEYDLKLRGIWLVLLWAIRINFNIQVWACRWSATCM